MRWESARDDRRSYEEQFGQDLARNIAVERVTISRFLKKQNALLSFNFVYIIAYHRRQL